MKKSNIYTCTGDAGNTSLVGGKRVKKSDIRLEAYGSVDELNSYIGLLVAESGQPSKINDVLVFAQNKLFNIGAYLATDNHDNATTEARGLNADDISRLESAIDMLDSQLPPLNNFVLPGGTREAATAHVCRTVCRRCERHIVDLGNQSYVSPTVLKFVNRLSDFLFVLARFYNVSHKVDEIFWNKDC